MKESLLQKGRELNRVLNNSPDSPVNFHEMARSISRALNCGVYLVGRRGQIIGYAFEEKTNQVPDIDMIIEYAERFPESFNQSLLQVQETCANMLVDRCIFKNKEVACDCQGKFFTLLPLIGGRRRLGTLILYRAAPEFSEEDIILAEYGAMIVANEVMYLRIRRMENEAGRTASIKVALSAMSNSEREALQHILAELKAPEGLLVASKVADRVGITRSVIASALRKLESAGIIESRSLGMKGTYIKILSSNLKEELEKF